MSDGVRAMWMRGGTSKGGYFLADDLPRDKAERDKFLLSVMGSPDPRQIDGLGGGDPLSSKIAVVSKSACDGVDVDYLFLQVMVDRAIVTDAQNCGNILAGIGPFAIERGLVAAATPTTDVSIFMENTGQIAVATVSTPNGMVSYDGDARIDGVPGTHAPVPIVFKDTAGSSCGSLFPTGNTVDRIADIDCTLIDNGMPCAIMRAADFGLTGKETPEELEENKSLRQQLETIRLTAGPLMNLGNVSDKTVPKMTLISPPENGGAISTRTFIPHNCHKAIGVLGAVSVATACLLQESVASGLAIYSDGDEVTFSVEHPTGEMTVVAKLKEGHVVSAGILRTARKLFDGIVY